MNILRYKINIIICKHFSNSSSKGAKQSNKDENVPARPIPALYNNKWK